jgi:hypothetical protein
MNYAGLEDPVLRQPFTVVDPDGSVWTVATDRVWMIATKVRGASPRFRGNIEGLNVILRMLRLDPVNAVEFDKADVLKRLDPDGLGRVLGVAVSLKRLQDLLVGIPKDTLLAWNASIIGPPAIGFTCEGWRAFLMGFENARNVEEVSLVSTSRQLFDLAMSLDEGELLGA